MPGKRLHGFCYALVGMPAEQRNAFEYGLHPPIVTDP
jgi:hypothetical protein